MPGHITSDWRPQIVNSHRRFHVEDQCVNSTEAPATKNAGAYTKRNHIRRLRIFIMGMANTLPRHCVLPRRGAQHERMYDYVCGFHTESPAIASGEQHPVHII